MSDICSEAQIWNVLTVTPGNSMKCLNVFLEMNGEQQFVGSIEGEGCDDAAFCYASSYIYSGGLPISVSLPLQEQAFDAYATKRFFEGLLPEGFTRRSVAQWIHADEEDYLTILARLGKECLGAIRIEDTRDPVLPEAAYRKLTKEEVRLLAAEGASRAAEIVVASHLSLTGASGKAGLYYQEKAGDAAGTWYQPLGTAASTHIVKQSHVRLKNIVENEQLALRTAAKLGIPTAESFIVNSGNFDDGDILLATRRYDRDLEHSTFRLNGLPVPLRLHQEDFAQAMGISSSEKYEPEGGTYFSGIFRLLRNVSANPLEDQIRLLDILIFDVLIGNTDNHIKNLSLLYSSDLRQKRLAPAYDIVSTVLYPESTRQMAFAVGGVKDWNQITKNTFLSASHEIGISPRIISAEYDRLSAGFPEALRISADELEAAGFRGARNQCVQILENSKEKYMIFG